jgi:anti-sigma factor RsiW
MEGRPERHLEPEEVVAYVDGAATGDERRWIESHLATCADCRQEVREIVGIVRALPGKTSVRRRIWLPAAAAAAIVLILAWPRHRPGVVMRTGEHRQGVVTTTVAPRPLAPVGSVIRGDTLVWSSVPGADAYAIRLFDASNMLWEGQTTDTVATLPASVGLRAGATYYWKVEARTGFGRWVASELVEFMPPNGRSAR